MVRNIFASPVKLSALVYTSGALYVNIYGTYIDSKRYLYAYREKKLHLFGLNSQTISEIRNDWDAIKYGAKRDFRNRLFGSMIWPIDLCWYMLFHFVD